MKNLADLYGSPLLVWDRIEARLNEGVVGVHENIPPGVAPADNELGFRMSFAKLAKLVETEMPLSEGSLI